MDWIQVEKNWPKWQPMVGREWEKLTEKDLESLSGNREQLAAIISERYKITSEEAERQITTWLCDQ